MKLNKSTLKDMIREAMSSMTEEPANPSSAQEWHAWGETFGLAPEHDEDNQLIFYLSRDSQDPNKAAAEAARAGASVDRDNDGNDVIYTGVYNEALAEQPEEEFSLDPEKIKLAKADSIAGLFWSPNEQAARIARFEEEYPGEDWQELADWDHSTNSRRQRRREQVAETITKSTLKDMIREAIRAIHE
jgi:hypothetical protein